MTTIAVNKTQIACDLQATHPGGLKFKIATKIFEVYQPMIYPKRFMFGMAGNLRCFPDALEFFADPENNKPPKGGLEGVVLTEDKKIFMFERADNWILLTDNKYAIGSGMNYAIAAMEAGKEPIDAVKIASKFDPSTGLGFKKLEFK
jgi:hypothetical protein